MSTPPDTDGRDAREKRAAVILRALVSVVGRRPIGELRVRNLSPHGACVDHDAALRAGDRLAVDMGLLTGLTATVMWATDRLAGLRFDQEVDLELARKPRAGSNSVRSGWVADMRSPY